MLSSLGKDSITNAEVNRYYNLHLDALESKDQESYRKIYIISKRTKPKLKTDLSNKDSLQVQMELTDLIFRELGTMIIDKNKIIAEQNRTINTLKKQIDILVNSISWKLTKPLRKARNLTKNKK